MNEEEARNNMMDYLYNEMSPYQKKEFEAFLKNRPELKKELDELAATRQLIQSAHVEVPPYKLVMIPSHGEKAGNHPDQTSKSFTSKIHPAVKTVFAIAASILIILTGAYFSGLQTGITDTGFYLTFGGEIVQQPTGISEEQVFTLIEQMRNEQNLILYGMMEQLQQQQDVQLNEVLEVLTDYYNKRRQQDLLMIADGFNQLEEQTNYRFTRTHETLGSLIYALSNPQ